MSRSLSHSSPTGTKVRGGGPPKKMDITTPMDSGGLLVLELTSEGQESEALVKGNYRFHVDDTLYEYADGNYRCK